MVEQSQRDVVFTPFMLRVREAVGHDVVAPTVLHMEASRPTLIAVAVDEWFGLRARAEHVISEANGMLDRGRGTDRVGRRVRHRKPGLHPALAGTGVTDLRACRPRTPWARGGRRSGVG